MNQVQLTAQPRVEAGKAPSRRLRREGLVPAVVYGLDAGAEHVSVPARALQHILSGGANTLIELLVEGNSQLTLAREIQRHPVRGTLLHVDFVRVRADQTIDAEIALHLVGEPVGVRDGGRLEQILFSVSVSAQATAIPPTIEIEVSDLELEGRLHVSDLPRIAGVTYTQDPDTLLAHVAVPRGMELPEEEAAAEGEEAAAEAGEGAEAGGGSEGGGDEG
jgi:large subunit ribosomal protein L25